MASSEDDRPAGHRDGVKGIYLIKLVETDRLRPAATQFEFVGTVVGISERLLVPLVEGLPRSFPFPIFGFHADNGSEYINQRRAALLDKLRVERFTKSSARRYNDPRPSKTTPKSLHRRSSQAVLSAKPGTGNRGQRIPIRK